MIDSRDLPQRVIELETRIAFQEHALQEMSEVMARQQAEITQLKLELREARDRLRGISAPVADRSEETPPPHY